MRLDEPESSAIQTSSTVNIVQQTSTRARTFQDEEIGGTAELREDSPAIRRSLEKQESIHDAVINGDWENQIADFTEVDGLHTQPDPQPRLLADAQRLSNDEAQPNVSRHVKDEAVSWRDLPNKKQLTILTLARLSEPLSQSSLQSYMFYQLKSFNPTLPDSSISFQAGVLQASFTGAQFMTAFLWGRIADSEWGGRKRVLLVGILGTCVSCVGVGFSTSFVSAALFRTFGGAMNGNLGVLRTMISEIIGEKKSVRRSRSVYDLTAGTDSNRELFS